MSDQPSTALLFKELRNRSGLSMDAVAKALNWKFGSAVQRYEDPKRFKRRYLPLDLAEKLLPIFEGRGDPPIQKAEILALAGFPLPDLHTVIPRSLINKLAAEYASPAPGDPLNARADSDAIYNIGTVEAGVWRQEFELPRNDWKPLIFEDGSYPGVRRFAAAVRGNAFAPRFFDGDYAIFIHVDEVGILAVPPSATVLVLRRQGSLVEATLREFVPSTSRGRLKRVRRFSDMPNAFEMARGEVKIEGVVVGALTHMRPALIRKPR